MQENRLNQNADTIYSQYSDDELYNLAEEYDESCEEEKALPIYKLLALKGNSKAQFMLGFYYDLELGGLERNVMECIKWYEQSALKGNCEAMNALGDIYIDEDTSFCNTDKAIYWYEKSIESGWFEGYISLGHCYKDGTGVEQDFQKAYDLYMKALSIADDDNKGFVYYHIGKLFFETEQYSEALSYLLKVDEEDDQYIDLHFIIGKCYFDGLGTDVNYQEAVKYMNKACKYGIPEAYQYLGTCYLNGYGVLKDEKFANECFRKYQNLKGELQ